MSIIKVHTDTLPTNGYEDICRFYNQNRTPNSNPIREAGVWEGGFEISLTDQEIANINLRTTYPLDPNDKVRQVRWSRGRLLSMGYVCLQEEEYQLLYKSLVHVLGKDKVSWI
jgi:hypothetical protein